MTENSNRPVDIRFVADRTPRRERLIAATSAMLWEWRTDIRFGQRAEHEQFSPADARIMLCIHGDDDVTFDWELAADAIANGCVVVSETARGFEPLVPGVHFVMAPYENVVEQAVALAFDELRRSAMADDALKVTLPQASAPPSIDGDVPVKRIRLRRNRSVSPRTRTTTLDQLVTEMKTAIVAQRELSRSIESSISLVEHGDPNHADSTSTSAWGSCSAEVSVVVTLFNTGRHLRDTVESVLASSGPPGPSIELLIVDDHSTDDSRELAEAMLAEIDWFPATLLSRAANAGPAAARNLGFNAARAPHVFSLDAGSTVYPTGLRRLLDGLAAASTDVVATYGLVEQFDTTGSLGLAGHLPWMVDLLVQGEMPDTIAMFRRDLWSELGGFTTPSGGIEDGWEDYDLWLTAAERGLRAEVVGSVIGRSRLPLASLLDIRNTDTASTFITLRERHPRLPWPS